jgi:hypothetical protein
MDTAMLSERDRELESKGSQIVQLGEPFFSFHPLEDQVEWLSVYRVNTCGI